MIDQMPSQGFAFPILHPVDELWRLNWDSIVADYEGRPTGSFMPSIYQIEPTSLCNLDCIMCPNRALPAKQNMSLELYKDILAQIAPYARAVKLSYLGEPLMHPDIAEFITLAKANCRNATVTLFTNATLLSHEIGVKLVRSGLDYLVFSLDGGSAKTYETVRKRASYDIVVRNVEDFLLFKGKRAPACTVNFVKMHVNESEKELVRQRWTQYGCRVEWSWLNTWAGQLGIESLSSSYKWSNQPPHRSPCSELWFKILINASGKVLLCCNDYTGKENLGSMQQDSISSIWNSPKIQSLRNTHRQHRYATLALCRQCVDWSDKKDMECYLPESKVLASRP